MNRVIAEPGANSLQVFIVMDVKPPGEKKIILDKIASPFAICHLPFVICHLPLSNLYGVGKRAFI